MKQVLVILIIFAQTFKTHAQQTNEQSLLWEITGNNLKSPSYLYGTMHVSNKIAFHLGDTFFQALQQAEVIALESDPGKWMEEMFASKSAMAMNGYRKYLDFDSDKNFYETLSSVESPDKKTLTNALRKKHALQNGFLYRGSGQGDEYEETTYLDLFIYQYGKKNKKTVINLEEHETTNILQIKAMLPDPKLSEAEEKEKKKKRKSYYSQWDEKITVREALEEAYRKGQVNIVDSIMKLTARSDNYMKYFLYERNKIMAEGMDSLLQSKKIFTGVGAAHLAGKEGIIELLRAKGYHLRPVQRKITQFAKNEKNKIEETFLPVKFTKQTTNDGYLSVNIPGPLYETPGERGDIQYFYPEMINGGYFFIRRFSTFSPLHNKNPSEWEKRVDSLLFENIEGKIITEKKIKINGFNAKDILNKTRNGDFQRRIIVYTPLELIFFKMSGTGNWVNDYGDEFFESISINIQKTEKHTYTSHLNDYSINFPAPPIHNVHAEKLHEASRHVIQSVSPADSNYFALFSSLINDENYIEEDSFEVGFINRTFFEQFDSAEIKTYDLINPKEARAGGIINGESVYTKAILRRNFYFLLVAKSNKALAEQYFNSFQYHGEFKKQTFETYHDTVLHYTVNTSNHPDPVEDLMFSVRQTRRKRNKNTWDSFEANRQFDNGQTKETIHLNYYKFEDYYSKKDLDEFWKDELSNLERTKLIIKKKTIDNSAEFPTCHVQLSDTGSTKIIEIKKYLNQGVIYSLKTSYDSLGEKSAFIDSFFTSFTPLRDSLIGKSVTKNSANEFFHDLKSMDSLRVKKAIEMVNLITFEKEHIDSILWLIQNYKFPDEDKKETKIYLIRELGFIKSSRVINLLVNLYEESDENSKEQFAALKGLAKLKTKKSYKALQKLLIDNPPIASSKNTTEYLFHYFDDSLHLTKSLYPKLWDLMLYEKYREPVYELSTSLLDSGLIKPSSYKKYKPLILRQAKASSLKKRKYSSSIKLSSNDYYYKNSEKVTYNKLIIDQFDNTKFFKLLVPYYKKDKSVQKFFDKTFQSDNDQNRLIAAVLFAKNNIHIEDSILNILSNSATYMYPFYKDLQLLKKSMLFETKVFDQEKMAKSILYAGSNRIEPEEDSIVFVKKIPFTENGEKSFLYFFKSESNYGNKWQLHYAGLMPQDDTKIMDKINFSFIDRQITVYNEKNIEEEIESTIKKLHLRDRKRAKKSNY